MMRRGSSRCTVTLLGLLAAGGCQSLWYPNVWPFPEIERTTYRTPSMRADAVRQFATRADGTDSPQQREMTDQLARQIQIEPDPLVRLAVVETIAEFKTPMTQQVLESGLNDENKAVRVACCKALGRRAEVSSIPKLALVLKTDKEIDVRLAATAALGNIKSPEAMAALAVALDDRDPALQYVGVQSMKSVTGKDYGGNVEAWRQVARGGTPPEPKAPSIAERMRGWSPF